MIALEFVRCHPPRSPRGVIAFDRAATALASAVLDRDDVELAALQGAADTDCLAIFSDDDSVLPWADGALYIAPLPGAPLLWCATTEQPTLPPPLVANALRRTQGQSPVPCAVFPERDQSQRWISFRDRGAVDRGVLSRFVQEAFGAR